MKILVCFKLGADLDRVIDSDWEDFSLLTNLSYAGRIINCFDESALEIALRLKDEGAANGKAVECTALTLGQAPPLAVWQSLYAAGFNDVVVIESVEAEFQSGWVASELSSYAKNKEFDLILTGMQAGLADTGTVAFLMAEQLSLPVIGEVENVNVVEPHFMIDKATDSGRVRLTVAPPAIVSVGNSPVACLRAVTLRSKMAAAKRHVTTLAACTKPCPALPHLSYDSALSQCFFLDADNMAKTAGDIAAKFLPRGVK